MWRIVLYLILINRCGQWGVSPASVNSRWVELSWTSTSTSVLCSHVHFYLLFSFFSHYGRPLSVSGRPCYILPMFLFICFLWPPYSPALVNGSSRKFYTWWTLSVIREINFTTWIFSWSSLNYSVGQKWRNLAYFQTRPARFLLSRPNAAAYCNSEKNLLSTDGCSTRNATFRELWRTNPWHPHATLFNCS